MKDSHSFSPAQLVAGSFALLVLVGTTLLLLPMSRADGSADFVTALFTATSAVCLTGLIVVDTATYWSHFGQAVIMMLIQLGGLGIMTLATIASWVIAGQIGVKSRLNASAEGRGGNQLGDVKTLLVATLSFTAAVEGVIATFLIAKFHLSYGYDWGSAIWQGTFHSISAFNNAGFSLESDNLVLFVNDIGLLFPIACSIMIGGVGYPVLLELTLRLRRRTQGFKYLPRLSLTTQFVVAGSLIGGGSGGTAGGVKITTVAVLLAVMVSEIRGDEYTLLSERRIPNRTMRQALAVFMLAGSIVVVAIGLVQLLAPEFSTHQIVFEVISAFATVGLSTGITGSLPVSAKLLITVLMYSGRIGPITLVAAMAARSQRRQYSYPVERPLIG